MLFAVFFRRSSPRAEILRSLAALVGPALLLLGAWVVWKTAYYGEILPNTFVAKTGTTGALLRGLDYLWVFAKSYVLLPVLVLIAAASPRLWVASPRALTVLVSMLVAHSAYVAAIGGDFMEFRMMVPVLPLLFVLVTWSLLVLVKPVVLRVACVLLVLGGAAYHASTFAYTKGIETIAGLGSHLDHPAADWVGIGKKLGETFRDSPDVRIAVTPAGAIPFHSRLPSIDMLGLNDPWVARHGIPIAGQPGHSRVAPVSYLVDRRANLALAHPWVRRPSRRPLSSYALRDLRRLGYLVDVSPATLPAGASIVEIPLDESRVVVALYLTPHPAVEALIRARSWRNFTLTRDP
jgi:hypothetical protein